MASRFVFTTGAITGCLVILALLQRVGAERTPEDPDRAMLAAPAGDRPATEHFAMREGAGEPDGAVLPNGRYITPAGREISVQAPKPFGMALSPDGKTLATANSGSAPFSVTLIRNFGLGETPKVQLVRLNAVFMGVVFAKDSSRFYVSGGDDGVIWVGETDTGRINGVVNLNGPKHRLSGPIDVERNPAGLFTGSFPGNLALSRDGRFLYATDQASFAVDVIDTSKIVTGLDGNGHVIEANNFEAVGASAPVGRYPFAIGLSRNGTSMYVANVGVFEYTHLRPDNPTGDLNRDYPLGFPGAGYPDETEKDRKVRIEKIDPADLPPTLSIADAIRVGYVPGSLIYTVPGLGSPNVIASSSVYGLSLGPGIATPQIRSKTKTGPLVGEADMGVVSYSGSHPNAIAVAREFVYVSNGNDDSVSILDGKTNQELRRVSLSVFGGALRSVKGVQPVALALTPDSQKLYVAEAGLNAVAVLRLSGNTAFVEGLIPTAWWPSSIQISADGKWLYVACANGRGSGPNVTERRGDPKYASIGTVHVIPVPTQEELKRYTARVMANNGFVPSRKESGQIPAQVKHVIFLNKENATFDLLLGDLIKSRRGVPIAGEPRFSLGYSASPNHHELALQFTVGDNFFLEPSCSSDGHRWLTDTYTTEFEQTNWPANYGDKRSDAGDNPEVYIPYPGRLDFTGDDSPEPNDYDEHGGVYLHLARHGKSFVNFGNGFELSGVNEDFGTEPTGVRNHVNVPMEKVVRDHTDQLYAEFNLHIPDAPQAGDPKRYSRYGRFEQVFRTNFLDAKTGACKLPDYVDLYFPSDHGGSPNDINPKGPAWSFTRYVQDNDDALGRAVQLVSHSSCWKDTVIFVVEDDVQNGMDHVNGARSLFLAIGPWVKRQYVAKRHYSLSSVFKTVYEILGIPPLNLYDVAATDLRDIFTETPDFTPYETAAIQFATVVPKSWGELTRGIRFDRPDADEVRLRHAILVSEGLPRR